MDSHSLTSYTVLDLLSWQESGTLHVSPRFQRRAVWKQSAKGFFIDSILRGYPIPPIHIRIVSDGVRAGVREVIDGQQRIRAVFEFVQNKYRIPASVSDSWPGMSYHDLTEGEQQVIKLFNFTVYQYREISDAMVLEMFARLNTYSVSLNKQELRNGKWFGAFKRVSYRLAHETLDLWREFRVFTDSQIARMREVEFVSELLVLQMDGLQDKKTSLDQFYENLDANWSEDDGTWVSSKRGTQREVPTQYLTSVEAELRFRETLKSMHDAVGDLMSGTSFRRTAMVYTVYGAIYHIVYGLPRLESSRLCGVGLTDGVILAMRETVSQLIDALDDGVHGGSKLALSFVEGAAQQTDNYGPRETRLLSFLRMMERSLPGVE